MKIFIMHDDPMVQRAHSKIRNRKKTIFENKTKTKFPQHCATLNDLLVPMFVPIDESIEIHPIDDLLVFFVGVFVMGKGIRRRREGERLTRRVNCDLENLS